MLIVIGNGFDLNLGLKTSWSDFIHWEKFRQLKNENNFFQHLHRHHDLNNWIDAEHELGNYALELKEIPVNSSEVKNFNEYFKELSSLLISFFIENNIGEKFDSWGNTKAGELVLKTQKIITNKVKPVYIVDFNYTNTFNTLLEVRDNDRNYFKINNIHGTYKNNNIIFGYEHPKNNLPARDFGFIKKSYRDNYNGAILKTQLDNESEVVIFGHSLGITDHHYFKDFFSKLLTTKNKIDIKIFYYKDINPITSEIDEMIDNKMDLLKNNSNVTLRFINCDDLNANYSLITRFEIENHPALALTESF